jgi:hypothetical protein
MLRMTDIFNDQDFGAQKKAEDIKDKIMREALPFGNK